MNQAGRRKGWIAGTIVVVVLAVGYGFLPGRQEVDLAAVTRGPLRVTVEEEGRTRLKERFVLSAPTAGQLRRIVKKAGDPVQKGEILAMLDPLRSPTLDPRSRATAEAALAAAEAALAAARQEEQAVAARADYGEKRRTRMAGLYAKGSVAKDTFDQAEAEAKQTRAARLAAQATVQAAQADRERAAAVLRHGGEAGGAGQGERVAVTAPVDGIIFRLYRESEGTVQAGEPLLEVGDQGRLEVRAEVLSTDAVRIAAGMPVFFSRWGREEPLAGRVKRVEPGGFTKVSSLGVEEQRVLVILEITSPPERWQALGDAFRLEVHFVLWEGQEVLQVPAGALFRQGEGWSVFVAEQGRARLRPVRIGHRTGQAAEVLAGLAAGERVVAYPDDRISDGTRIRPR